MKEAIEVLQLLAEEEPDVDERITIKTLLMLADHEKRIVTLTTIIKTQQTMIDGLMKAIRNDNQPGN